MKILLFLLFSFFFSENYNDHSTLDKLPEPINFKKLKPTKRFDFTAGGSIKTINNCYNLKEGYIGQYTLLDKESKLKPPIVGHIRIYNKGAMSDWKFDDENQKILKFNLKSDVLTLWDTIKIGNNKSTIHKYFSSMNGIIIHQENLTSYTFQNFKVECFYRNNLLSEIKITKRCNEP